MSDWGNNVWEGFLESLDELVVWLLRILSARVVVRLAWEWRATRRQNAASVFSIATYLLRNIIDTVGGSNCLFRCGIQRRLMIYGETWNPGENKKALAGEGGIRIAKRYSIRASKLFGEGREGRWLYVCIRFPIRYFRSVKKKACNSEMRWRRLKCHIPITVYRGGW